MQVLDYSRSFLSYPCKTILQSSMVHVRLLGPTQMQSLQSVAITPPTGTNCVRKMQPWVVTWSGHITRCRCVVSAKKKGQFLGKVTWLVERVASACSCVIRTPALQCKTRAYTEMILKSTVQDKERVSLK